MTQLQQSCAVPADSLVRIPSGTMRGVLSLPVRYWVG